MRPLMTISLVCLTLSRFAVDAALSEPSTKNLVVTAFVAPSGSELLVTLFWVCLLALMVYASCANRPKILHGLDFVLIPEIVALGLFFLADSYLEAFKVLDVNLDAHITMDEVKERAPWLLTLFVRRWLSGNFAVLLSFTITESISPQTFSLSGLALDAGWAILFAQAVAMFLHTTLCRSAALASWAQAYRGSVSAALLYGFALYYYTHGLALIAAVVFRRHEGVPHPPTVGRVFTVVARQGLMPAVARCGIFILCLLITVLVPAIVDHPYSQAHHHGEGHESHLLHAVSQGLLSGLCGCFVLSCINIVTVMAALRCYMRPQVHKIRSSYEAALAWGVGGLGSLAWCRLLSSEDGLDAPWWQFFSALLAFTTHVCLAAFSADVFAGRQVPNWTEAITVTFWAALQCVEGLAAEHHAATSHHCYPMNVGALLEHLGEFGLCEFGLIVTLAWVTDNMSWLYKKYSKMPPPKYGSGSDLAHPLIAKKA